MSRNVRVASFGAINVILIVFTIAALAVAATFYGALNGQDVFGLLDSHPAGAACGGSALVEPPHGSASCPARH